MGPVFQSNPNHLTGHTKKLKHRAQRSNRQYIGGPQYSKSKVEMCFVENRTEFALKHLF